MYQQLAHWQCASLRKVSLSTIGDEDITYLTFIRGELFVVISCIWGLQKRNSRGFNLELPSKSTYLNQLQIN